jgi:peptidyl-prolyl cis-trans isomerase C
MMTRSMKMTVAGAILFALAACNPAAKAPSGAAPKPPVATVNGKAITADEFAIFVQTQTGKKAEDLNPEQKKQIVDLLVGAEVGAQEAEKQGLANDPETKARLDFDRTNILFSALAQKYMKDKTPSEAELKAEYDARIAQMPKNEFKARHILVKTEDEAKDVIAKLDKGAKFEDLAKAVSMDGSKSQGGDLGWFQPGQMVKPFSEAVEKLAKGETTKAPVQSEFGWHVIQLEDTRPITPPPFDQVKDRIAPMVQQKKIKDYIDGLRKAAKIEIKADAAAPAAAAAPAPAAPAAAPAAQ